jgi:hypothetical protein
MRVGFKAVVVHSELLEPWHQLDQVDPTAVVALALALLHSTLSERVEKGSMALMK